MPEAGIYFVMAEDDFFGLSALSGGFFQSLIHQINGVTLQSGTADYSQ